MKLNYIQNFRGIAILLVVLTHTTHHGFSDDIGILFLDNLVWFGHQGVTLFFVISAFTIFYSLDNHVLIDGNVYRKFLIRRFFRIAPLYYLGIIVYHIIINNQYGIDCNLISNILFINWVHPDFLNSVMPGAWSITTEFTFYFIAPLLFKYLNNLEKSTRFFLVTVLCSRILVSVLVKIYPNVDTLYYTLNPISHFPVFILGVMLYRIIIKEEKLKLEIIHLILISLIIFLDFILGKGTVVRDHYFAAIMFSVLVYINSKISFPAVISSILSFIGELSFTIYISHFLVIIIIKKYDLLSFEVVSFLNWFERFFLVLGGALVISLPLYYLIEKPFMNLGKNLSKKIV